MAEKQNIEWKQSWRDEYLQWICAFANTEGGKLIIGKDDKGQTVENGGIELTFYKIDPSEKLTTDFEQNKELIVNEYGIFIDYVSMDSNIPSEKLRRI